VREGRVVWDNLRKILLVNTPINNAQGMSVLFALACGLKNSPLTSIQVLYSNLICACTLGFVCAIGKFIAPWFTMSDTSISCYVTLLEPAEDGIMDMPPRRVGKRLVGRYLFFRIAVGTWIMITVVLLGTFWARSMGYGVDVQRSVAFNVLDFGAISICLSARFSYNSSFHPRIFQGNPLCWYSVILVAVLQFVITYTPGLNQVIFNMAPMNLRCWGITLAGMLIVFFVMEVEKAILRVFKRNGGDTDDLEPSMFDKKVQSDSSIDLPKGASKLGLEELKS
jgi:magnesium-transporting ATPase (P-type)